MRHSIGHWQKIAKPSCGRAKKNPHGITSGAYLGAHGFVVWLFLPAWAASHQRVIVTCWSLSIYSCKISVRASAHSFISSIMLTLEFERASFEDSHVVFVSLPVGWLRWLIIGHGVFTLPWLLHWRRLLQDTRILSLVPFLNVIRI